MVVCEYFLPLSTRVLCTVTCWVAACAPCLCGYSFLSLSDFSQCYWGLNLGPCVCWASPLPLGYVLSSSHWFLHVAMVYITNRVPSWYNLKKFSLKSELNYLLGMCAFIYSLCVCTCCNIYVRVRGSFVVVGSPLPPFESWGSISAPQTWQQVLFPAISSVL